MYPYEYKTKYRTWILGVVVNRVIGNYYYIGNYSDTSHLYFLWHDARSRDQLVPLYRRPVGQA